MRPAERRQAGAVLRRASRQLGAAGGGGARRMGCRPRWSTGCRTTRRWRRRSAAIRAPLMGRLIRTRAQAALEMAAALERGEHLGMLVDQHFSRGVDVTFFGRRCKANPTMARLARQFDCPVVGVRVIRLPEPAVSHRGRGAVRVAARRGGRGGRDGGDADDHRMSWNAGCASIPSNGCGSTGAGGNPALAVIAGSTHCHRGLRWLPQLGPLLRLSARRHSAARETAFMRSTLLSAVLVTGLITPALAQTGMPPAPGTAPAYPPLGTAPAYPPPGAPVPSYVPPTTTPPPGADSATGARPGNDVGTGMSLPMGTHASNIDGQDTRSEIAPNLPSPQLGPNAATGRLPACRTERVGGRPDRRGAAGAGASADAVAGSVGAVWADQQSERQSGRGSRSPRRCKRWRRATGVSACN